MADLAAARREAEEALAALDEAYGDLAVQPSDRHDRVVARSVDCVCALRALLAAEPAKGACGPTEAPNPAKGGPPLLVQRVLQLAVAALHTERHHTLAEEVRSVAVTLSAPAAGEREEIERLRDSIEIEREGQRSMARALAEINRLSRLDVAIALAPGDEVAR